MDTSWIGLVITGVFGILLTLVSGIIARRGQRIANKEQRAPDVQEMWAQQEADRRARQAAEDMWWRLWRAFQSFYRRVMAESRKWNLTEEQLKVLELTPKEQAAIDARLPED